jgi:phosphoglycerol transferase MdoB-like AlkP superfamily enzyme
MKFYSRFTAHMAPVTRKPLYVIAQFMLIPVCFLLIRGGWQTIPVSESAAYYSAYNPNNHAAVNPVFYFIHDVAGYYSVNKDKYRFFKNGEEQALFNELMLETGTDTIKLTSVEHPNLVIILLESWTADVVEALGGEKGVTPFTNELVKESYLFSRCYGPGYRTDQGLVSVLAGYPTQPDNSIIAYPSKTESLPAFCKVLKAQGYGSSFFYGGDIGFANMKSFIVQQGFEYISDKNNYDPKDYNSKWGAHDGKVLESQIAYLDKTRQPFISGLLTLSTHEPFEVPIKHIFPHDTDPNKFKNAAYYTDACLKNYFAAAKKSAWYQNTLILLVADHGHHLPRERSLDSPESKHITCILAGGALDQKLRGKKWAHVIGQHDLVKWLAPCLHLDPKPYRFSKDPYTAKHPFAFYANENVLGLVTDSTSILYDIPTGVLHGNTRAGEFARAYLQEAYADFTKR